MKYRDLFEADYTDTVPYESVVKIKKLISKLANNPNCIFVGDIPPVNKSEETESNSKTDKKETEEDELTKVIYSDALDLIHHVYDEVGVQRPTVSMRSAWKQYEEMISFAVEQLDKATTKGIRSDNWKTTSAKLRQDAGYNKYRS